MSEFLIYNKVHWMSELSQEEVADYIKKYPNFLAKYDARNQMGDVVEVRPDGYWTGPKAPGYDKSVYLVVTVPGLSFKDARHYGEPLTDDDKIIKKCRYNFGNLMDKQSFSNISQISITDKNG
jgi:hypothetical protein